jgi:hypothetical protein
MVLTDEVMNALDDDNVEAIRAWLDSNDYTQSDGEGMLTDLCFDPRGGTTNEQLDIIRLLLARGADINSCPDNDGWTALHCSAHSLHENENAIKLIEVILGAGANVNAKTNGPHGIKSKTPLGLSLEHWGIGAERSLEVTIRLLRAGASLDECRGNKTAEETLRDRLILHPYLASDPQFVAVKLLISEYRAAGSSWKSYVRAPPKALLRLRSLVARGRARDIKRLRAKTPREIALLLAPTFPNELFWKVMTYWNPRV